MTLSEKRCVFTHNLALLIVQSGQDIALDQVKRTQAEANANAISGAGIANSLHRLGLAADLLLYINGVYQSQPEAYRALGEAWEKMHELNRWGGDFHSKDANHFSMEHQGVQ